MGSHAGEGVAQMQANSVDTARSEAAREIVRVLRKTMSAFRSYPEGHSARIAATSHLYSALAQATAVEPLTLHVTSRAFFFDDAPVSAEESEGETLTRPLFVEGIQGLTFTTALTLEELERFLVLFHVAAAARFPEGHSLTTELWEAHLQGIETTIVENLSDGVTADAGLDDADAARARDERIKTLTDEMMSVRLPRGDPGDGSPTRKVSSADVAPLVSSSTLADALGQRINFDSRELTLSVDEEECRALASALCETTETIARTHQTIWRIAAYGEPNDQEKLQALAARVTMRFVEEGSLAVLRQGLSRTLAEARNTPHRMADIGRFFEILAAPEIVSILVTATCDEERRHEAVDVLTFLAPRHMSLVLERVESVADVPAARDALLRLVVRKSPTTESFAAAIDRLKTSAAAQTTTALIDTLREIRPEAVGQVVLACLSNTNPDVRRAVLKKIDTDQLGLLAPTLAKVLAEEPERDLRDAMVLMLVKAKRAEAVAALISLLRRRDIVTEERQTVLRALCHVGSEVADDAKAFLRQMFQSERDGDVLCSLALALGSVGDEQARGLLAAEAKRLFAPAALRAACVEAQNRLDARAAAGSRERG